MYAYVSVPIPNSLAFQSYKLKRQQNEIKANSTNLYSMSLKFFIILFIYQLPKIFLSKISEFLKNIMDSMFMPLSPIHMLRSQPPIWY